MYFATGHLSSLNSHPPQAEIDRYRLASRTLFPEYANKSASKNEPYNSKKVLCVLNLTKIQRSDSLEIKKLLAQVISPPKKKKPVTTVRKPSPAHSKVGKMNAQHSFLSNLESSIYSVSLANSPRSSSALPKILPPKHHSPKRVRKGQFANSHNEFT